MSESEQVKAIQVLMAAIINRRDELRIQLEEKPMECPDDLSRDFRGVSGEIRGLNWVLGLPARSRDFINKIK
jgi:hypothetical protein